MHRMPVAAWRQPALRRVLCPALPLVAAAAITAVPPATYVPPRRRKSAVAQLLLVAAPSRSGSNSRRLRHANRRPDEASDATRQARRGGKGRRWRSASDGDVPLARSVRRLCRPRVGSPLRTAAAPPGWRSPRPGAALRVRAAMTLPDAAGVGVRFAGSAIRRSGLRPLSRHGPSPASTAQRRHVLVAGDRGTIRGHRVPCGCRACAVDAIVARHRAGLASRGGGRGAARSGVAEIGQRRSGSPVHANRRGMRRMPAARRCRTWRAAVVEAGFIANDGGHRHCAPERCIDDSVASFTPYILTRRATA